MGGWMALASIGETDTQHHSSVPHVCDTRYDRKIFDEAVNESIVYLACMLLYYKVQ